MGQLRGFMRVGRAPSQERDALERLRDYHEFTVTPPVEQLREQGARCMDCGVPFCHTGCPVNNIIPDWNDLAYEGRWESAIRRLHATNNFPEFTGRICPAPVSYTHLRGLARRGTEAAGELGEVVGVVQLTDRVLPAVAVDEVVPVRRCV